MLKIYYSQVMIASFRTFCMLCKNRIYFGVPSKCIAPQCPSTTTNYPNYLLAPIYIIVEVKKVYLKCFFQPFQYILICWYSYTLASSMSCRREKKLCWYCIKGIIRVTLARQLSVMGQKNERWGKFLPCNVWHVKKPLKQARQQ